MFDYVVFGLGVAVLFSIGILAFYFSAPSSSAKNKKTPPPASDLGYLASDTAGGLVETAIDIGASVADDVSDAGGDFFD